MAVIFPFVRCSAYHALVASDRPCWSPWISRKKYTKSLGLDIWDNAGLAGMREVGKTAPLLSSRGKEAGQRKSAGYTCQFIQRKNEGEP